MQSNFADKPNDFRSPKRCYVSSDYTEPIRGRSYEFALALALNGVSSSIAVSAEVVDSGLLPVGMTDIKLKSTHKVLALTPDGWRANY